MMTILMEDPRRSHCHTGQGREGVIGEGATTSEQVLALTLQQALERRDDAVDDRVIPACAVSAASIVTKRLEPSDLRPQFSSSAQKGIAQRFAAVKAARVRLRPIKLKLEALGAYDFAETLNSDNLEDIGATTNAERFYVLQCPSLRELSERPLPSEHDSSVAETLNLQEDAVFGGEHLRLTLPSLAL
eukprot:CAMPEP_0117533182 /NCGR_PEP_ID=MMETSP0784-20121206/39756_1 /TAXON_ID=39447 /ORGANISM="" /LENGTH=187 /DNA_ID=CAMNT_0005329607 /DNA_START=22 /DNA_END=586 /DNA_ORIENTATION=-